MKKLSQRQLLNIKRNCLEVISKGITWEEANKNDWRKTGDWQPGWDYEI